MITPAQCRAARALIEWPREQLAEVSRVALRTIVDFERGARAPREVTLIAIRSALESAGVIFIDDERGEGVVKLRDRQQ
ncbi:helix-turn-helix domain-containing protein [Sinorhizobium meliloti]|jgi:transcriptional regulator with XRE-family HTH domain|uniref:helix-turn-helix domain-containing protein n=1 Tax=Rhizobium meliloti TaxID=382 RepID=UPI000FD716AA|nr:helix-turn-helix transcriptional regulator [Sinorhizobium meliloti]MDW9600405.1 helix-turn-helix domain-containing protein [Sinorhizobium meliloti]MQX70118.1 helix-turn-helix domain-containing protein [Sinorhizobium meliloti]RVM86355.1 XRE family transcriptional regulator [Sinorhizobium meliloti]